jgi:hypothetical protein
LMKGARRSCAQANAAAFAMLSPLYQFCTAARLTLQR